MRSRKYRAGSNSAGTPKEAQIYFSTISIRSFRENIKLYFEKNLANIADLTGHRQGENGGIEQKDTQKEKGRCGPGIPEASEKFSKVFFDNSKSGLDIWYFKT